MVQMQRSSVSSPDNARTMTPAEIFDSGVASTDYAINALSNPDDDTYRKNLARYLDSKGYDLISKDRQLYIGDRNSLETRPVTKSFMGEMIGSAPELAGSILGARAGIVGASIGSAMGDSVQQLINNHFFGEELTPSERAKELGKSAALGAAGEVAGNIVGRMITPLRGIDKAAQSTNNVLANKYNVELTPATATGHKGLSWFEELMSKGSLGGQSIAKAKEAEITGIENAVDDLLTNKMGATGNTFDSGSSYVYQTGKRQKNAEEYFTDRYGELVKAADVTEIPVVSLKGVAKEILDLSNKIPALKGDIDNLAVRILESPESITYPEYQQLRSFIGSKIKDASVTGQTGSKAAYKKLYGAINNDFDEVFKGSRFSSAKQDLDAQFREQYKEPFEDTFTKGVLGTSRSAVDPERIGGLIANSSGKAKTARNTADSGFIRELSHGGDSSATYSLLPPKRAKNTKSAAADYILDKSVARDGGMSLPKARTNLKKAKGIDTILEPDLKTMKDDIVKLIELSGQNNKVANHSGTAWMNEMLKMKNDPVKALAGFISDTAIAATYKRQLFQKWLTNGVISKPQYQRFMNNLAQVGARSSNE